MITKNKFVTVGYELRTRPEGELLERTDESTPLEFIVGHGQTLEYFEMNLLGLNKGDSFDFIVPKANAFGEVNEDMIIDLPMDIFAEVDPEELVVGGTLPMSDSLGRSLQGVIKEIGEETITMDLNHVLAGKDLNFKGTIVDVRDATDEELESLNSSHCGGCQGCGSDGGSDCGGCC